VFRIAGIIEVVRARPSARLVDKVRRLHRSGSMRRLEIAPERGFHILAGTARSQVATMVIEPGESEGDSENRHEHSDQWLYVLSGRGRARGSGLDARLAPGVLVLIEAGERHEIVNDGDEPLCTINIYAPPAY
jgi:mannose-6-phosphate isomerase-like protein (cupin superfamily)